MRLFVAIELPETIRPRVEALARNVSARIPDPGCVIRWVNPEQLHLTLKFIGECPDAMLARLKEALDQTARRHAPFGLAFGQLGTFSSGKSLRVLWLGTEDGTEAAEALAGDLQEACHAAGFALEKRPYHPHLTLARSQKPFQLKALAKIFLEHPQETIGPARIDRLSLIQSVLSPQGPRYTTLCRVPLNSGEPPRS